MSAARTTWHKAASVIALCAVGLALFGACTSPASHVARPARWVVFYGVETAPELLHDYDVVVLDPGFAGDLAAVRRKGAKVRAYLSLGELNAQRDTFAAAKAAGALVRENPNWPGAFVVDVRAPAWTEIAVDKMAAPLRARGFDGLFLDTLDSALALEREDAARYPGMRAAAVGLVRSLRQRWPGATLMVNGALELAGELRAEISDFAIESTCTTWDFQRKQALWLKPEERAAALQRLQAARTLSPRLQIYALDYWDVDDRAGSRAIYSAQRKAGLLPYVATIALDRVVPEPREPEVAPP